MGLIVHFRGGPLAGKSVEFDDTHERIVVGRDPAHCQVVFPADDTRVGREHMALIRELGRYRLQLNHDDLVFIDGKPAIDGQELRPREENVQIGRNGPALVIETVHDKKLVSTDQQGRQHSALTLLHEADQEARSGRRVAQTATILVVLAAAVGFIAWNAMHEDVIKGAKTLDDLTAVSQEQAQSLKGITTEVGNFKGQIKELDKVPALEKVVRDASKSVYLVLAKSPDGREEAEATAWVVDKQRGILATNAHVGRIPDDFHDNSRLIVRSSTEPVLTFTVINIDVHPGYDQFADLWSSYDPAEPVGDTGARSIQSAGWGCDVSLLTVDDPNGLADALPIAPPEVLAKLEPGYPVGLVGFPMEGIVLGGVNLKAPTPTRHIAYITAVTSYFGDANVPSDQRLLVQHALPTVGGASGSPILNSDGQVVAIHSAGNVIGSVESSGVRIVSAARIAYAQRADLIKELLDGNARTAQATRKDTWNSDIARYFSPRRDLESAMRVKRDKTVSDDINEWVQQLVAEDNYVVTTRVLTERVIPSSSHPKIELDVPEAGSCRVLAYGASGSSEPDLWLVRSAAGADEKLTGDKYLYNWLHKVQFDAQPADKLDVHLQADDESAQTVLRAVLATRKRVPPDKRIEALLNEWRTQWPATSGGLSPKQVYASTGTMPAPAADDGLAALKARIKIPDAGDYFIVASTTQDDPIGIYAIDERNAGNPEVLGSYVHEAPLAYAAIKPTAAMPLTVVVVGTKAGTSVDLKIFKATPEK